MNTTQGKICNVNNIILYQDDNALDFGMYNVEEKDENKLFKKKNVLFPTATFSIQIKYSHIPNSRTYTFIYFPKNRRPIRSY